MFMYEGAPIEVEFVYLGVQFSANLSFWIEHAYVTLQATKNVQFSQYSSKAKYRSGSPSRIERKTLCPYYKDFWTNET